MVGNFGYKMFSVGEVHKIGILDLRIMNCDRNEENILIKKSVKFHNNKKLIKLKMIPIDHGLSFPDHLDISQDEIVWMNWP